MGESVIGRPIGPSYVPGTSQGRSSANAPAFLQPTPTAATPATPANPVDPVPNPGPNMPPNPAQNPRQKWMNGFQNFLGHNPTSNVKVAGQYQAPSAIGTAQQNTGFRRYSIGDKSG